MTKEELLKPRFKVVALYPTSPYKVGEIISPDAEGNAWFNSGLSGFPEGYPDVFKPLKWWEERKPEDLPKYFWFKSGTTDAPSVAKVSDYIGKNSPYSIAYLVNCETEPATEEEFKKQGRGELTARIKQKSKELLGYEIGERELRLMPYIQNVMTNSQKIDPQKVNDEERKILAKWRKAGHIEGGAGSLRITEGFWNIICEIIRLGYVDLTE